MKLIIVPTDFSENSRQALEFSLRFLHDIKTPCRVLLLNTFIVQQTDPKEVLQLNDELKKKSKEGLDVEVREAVMKNKNPHVTVESISKMGSFKNIIKQIVQDENVKLVIMGEGDEKNTEEIENVLKELDCQLLVSR